MPWKLSYGAWLRVCFMLGKLVSNLLSMKLPAIILLSYLVRISRGCHPLFNLLHKCKSLNQGDWICKVARLCMYTGRPTCLWNADWMAKLGLQNGLGVNYIEDPPAGCVEIIEEDAAGWPVPRAFFFSVF
ncbi:hypothetical protein ACOSP7_000854 [Xanthoceras sorbifolium]